MVFVINGHVHVSEALFCFLTAGRYTVLFEDGVVHCVKTIHLKSKPVANSTLIKVTICDHMWIVVTDLSQ